MTDAAPDRRPVPWRDAEPNSNCATARGVSPCRRGDREGIRVRVVGDRVYLDGESITADDYERVQLVVSTYPQVKSFVRPSANAKRLAADSMNKALQRAGLRSVRASVVGGTLLLE